MALSKPTVAFDLTETRWSAGDAAIYVPPNDERRFAESIAWLLDHPEARARMGKLGCERVRTALAWEYSVPELLRAYAEGLGLSPVHSSSTPGLDKRTTGQPVPEKATSGIASNRTSS